MTADLSWAARIAEAGLASALLMALVLLVRAPVRRLFGPTVAYALWALPALRLVLPPLPESWLSRWAEAATPVTRATALVVAAVAEPAPLAAVPGALVEAPATAFPWAALLAGAWALVATAFFLWHLVGYRQFRRRLLADHRPLDRVGGVAVVESSAATGPLAFGVLRRYVVLPADLGERWDADERELALLHELGHHARGDLLANWAALAVLSVHWFNPLAWRAFRAFRADQELACDARVLRGRNRIDRAVYACAIVKAAHGLSVTPACHLHTVEDLKGRLRMLKLDAASRRRLVAGTASVALFAAAGLALTASGTGAAAAVRAVQEALPPAPPAPPVPPAAAVPPPAPAASERRPLTVVTSRGGRTTTRTLAPGEPLPADFDRTLEKALANMPDIRNGRCRGGDGPPSVTWTEKGRQVVMICQNRLERLGRLSAEQARDAGALARAGAAAAASDGRMAALDARMAALGRRMAARSPVIERDALQSARAGLLAARRSVETAEMTAETRAQALAGIDQGLREVEADMRRGGTRAD